VNAGRHQTADEQAALRRVATLAASAARPEDVFAAVAAEAGQLLVTDVTGVFRYDPDDATTCVGEWSSTPEASPFIVGARFRLGGHNTLTLISRTGRSARVEQAEPASGDITRVGRRLGFGPVAGAPVTVDGRLWGALVAMSGAGKTLPPTTEERLARFTELAAIAIASAQARMALSSFADEQAALRRVATLAATGAPPEEVFLAVSAEVQRLLSADVTGIARYDPGGMSTNVGGWSPAGPSPYYNGSEVRLGGRNVRTLVYETGQPARLDSPDDASGEPAVLGRRRGFRSAVGAPITVDGRLWGVMLVVHTSTEQWPPDTEARLTGFTELAATAIADAQARAQLRDFAAEQAALSRVATLVALGAPPADVFAAVADEAGRILRADHTIMSRYDPDGWSTVVASWAADPGRPFPIGQRGKLGGQTLNTLVFEARQPVRLDDYSIVSGETGTITREWGFRASVGAPIWVEGQLWGMIAVVSASKPLPPRTEERLAGFTELAATALANAEAQAALTASRARIVAAADQTRRRVERDLHDGAQQRLVSLALRLRAEQAALPPEADEVAERLEAAVEAAVGLQEELREISHGLYPAVLADSGLRPALRALARRSGIPVNVDVQVRERLAEPVEAAAYYAVSEALSNVVRHAGAAAAAEVEVMAEEGTLRVRVRDDGNGGADFGHGSGLTEVKDRVEAFGGRVSLHSPRGAGTVLEITLPLSTELAPDENLPDGQAGQLCLRQEADGRALREQVRVVGLGVGGDHYHRAGVAADRQLPGGVKPRFLAQVDINEHDIRVERGDPLDGVRTRPGCPGHLDAVRLQHGLSRREKRSVVIDYDTAQHRDRQDATDAVRGQSMASSRRAM
jgi:signal transduction histidine kinase